MHQWRFGVHRWCVSNIKRRRSAPAEIYRPLAKFFIDKHNQVSRENFINATQLLTTYLVRRARQVLETRKPLPTYSLRTPCLHLSSVKVFFVNIDNLGE